ncbi:MAG: Coenzyme F420 hydrogenase/dehydrogenase, beta subunit C-terminal domain [Candidatus Methylarchaceae archaeon HK02M1]|nr:Coenzyme F420 hydrogenase/dehydrogenase, beta subunit C-terminal domain [Candidatus Methylarchaceae archaeon HK02M1]
MSDKPKIWGNLLLDVIRAGKCTFCGGCIAACPWSVIGFEGELPKLVGPCYACEICWYTCPRTIYDSEAIEKAVFGRTRKEDEYIGIYRGLYSARSNIKEVLDYAQDGGIATTLLMYALDKDIIDSAVVSEIKEEIWRPWPSIALEAKEVIKAAGTKYTPSPVLIGVWDASDNYSKSEVGVVGTPCEVQTLRKIQHAYKASYKLGSKVKLVIGLFCMESFGYKDLTKFVDSKGIELKNVSKFNISKGKFMAFEGEREALKVPISEIKACARGSCHICGDFTCEHADISVGSVGSPSGWSTVIVRTDIGEAVFKGACEAGYIEYKSIEDVKPGLNPVLKLSKIKKEQAREHSSEGKQTE